MDLGLLFRVLWRFKLIVTLGFLAAAFLATYSMARITPKGLQYREHEQWVSYSTLFVTQKGFPWGRTINKLDPNRYATYAVLYSKLATSDGVVNLVKKTGPYDPTLDMLSAAPVLSNDWNSNSPPLPLVSLWAISDPPARAQALVRRQAQAVVDFVNQGNEASDVPPDERVLVQVVRDATPPTLLKARSKTLPIVIFLTVMMATCGLAFVLENLRPRVRVVADAPDDVSSPVRRSA